MLCHQIFEPEAVRPEHEDRLIIMPNEIAASLEDTHAARAKHLAQHLGARVLAYERPLSASRVRFSLAARRTATHNMAGINAHTAGQLSRLIDREGAKQIAAVGNSGGGAEAIGITAASVFEVQHLAATDPPGVRKVPPFIGEVVDYALYQVLKEGNKPKSAEVNKSHNVKPEHELPTLSSIRRQVGEIATYSAAWRSPMTRDNLARIAEHLPDTAVSVIYPGLTYTADRNLLEAMAMDLNSIRDTQPDAAPFEVSIAPGTYHSRFEDYRPFSAVVEDLLEAA